MDLAVEEGTGGQYDGVSQEADAELRHGTAHRVAFDDQVVAGLGEEGQVGLVFQPGADRLLVQQAIGLGAGGADGGTFRGVEDAELDAGFIRCCRHGSTQGIDLAHQVTFADATDRRVATHCPQRIEVVGQQQRVCPRPGCGERGLGAGVTAADDDDIETGGIEHRNGLAAVRYRAADFTSGR